MTVRRIINTTSPQQRARQRAHRVQPARAHVWAPIFTAD
jgi:hypothetical protein